MGFIERSKSLRRKQSTINVLRGSAAKSEESEPVPNRSNTSRLPVHLTVTTGGRQSSGASDAIPRASPSISPLPRNNPLPTPDKDPFYQGNANSSTQTLEYLADSKTYRFPTPSPHSTPRDSPFLTPAEASPIGVALGSPRQQLQQHPRDSPRYLHHSQPSPLRTFSDPSISRIAPETISLPMPEPIVKLRKSKSRSFRNVFSRAPQPPTKPAASQTSIPAANWQYDRNYGSISTVSSKDPSNSDSSSSPAYIFTSESDSTSTWVARQQKRAETDLSCLEKSSDMTRQMKSGSGPKPPPAPIQIQPAPTPAKKTRYTEIKIPDMNQESRPRIDSGNSEPIKKSFLDVEIPRSEMDRYSVMFEKLLKPQPMSLAERRGATSKLRPLTEETPSTNLLHATTMARRRATSPAVPSPDIVQKSIVEATQHHKEAADRLMKMRRSKTAPTGSFKPLPAPQKTSIGEMARELRASSPTSPVWSEASLPLTPESVAPTLFSTNDEDGISKGIFSSFRDSNSSAQSGPAELRVRTDSLTEFTPPVKANLKLSSTVSPDELTPRAPRSANAYVHGNDYFVSGGSVARSVSVTRPRAGRHVPISVKQPVRPRLVDMDGAGGTRKSTMVMIEQA
ncbi:hypothetical protein ANO11243_095460 [Dothideomycetidae sp. 11243]|nr:hypothetical protein ANO11243_095460 [fungal sp. No.11243]